MKIKDVVGIKEGKKFLVYSVIGNIPQSKWFIDKYGEMDEKWFIDKCNDELNNQRGGGGKNWLRDEWDLYVKIKERKEKLKRINERN